MRRSRFTTVAAAAAALALMVGVGAALAGGRQRQPQAGGRRDNRSRDLRCGGRARASA